MEPATTRLASAVFGDPLLPENRADPYRIYRRMRAEEPVHRARDGTWVVTSYEHASSVLLDSRFSSNPARLRPEVARARNNPVRQIGTRLLLFLDPPDHTRLRSVVGQAFSPRMVETLRPRVRELVAGLLDNVITTGTMDVLADVGYPLPVAVIGELLDIPSSDHRRLRGWSSHASVLLDGRMSADAQQRGLAAAGHLLEYFASLVDKRRRRPGSDLVSALVAARGDAGRSEGLSRDELLAAINLLFMAGHETSAHLIGNGVLALLRHPKELARLRQDPSLVPTAVEELLRYDGPVHVTARIAATDVELAGQRVAAGDDVDVVLAAANRDPAQFPDPDRLNLARTPNRHLAFVAGPHYCMGATLARIEAQEALAALIVRLPDMELATREPTYRENVMIRGVTELRVHFRPGAPGTAS